MSSEAQKNAASSASGAQTAASQQSIAAQQAAMADLKTQLAPYTSTGVQAIQGQKDLIGLGAPGAQTEAIQKISQGDQFKAMAKEGENAILQNAVAATPKLRWLNSVLSYSINSSTSNTTGSVVLPVSARILQLVWAMPASQRVKVSEPASTTSEPRKLVMR
jgi:hypothetical protein